MKITDITGKLHNGMWSYEPPFPPLDIRPLPEVEWVETKVYCDIFDGMNSQSGTYLETPAHLLGDKSYPLEDVPVEKLYNIDAAVIKLTGFSAENGRQPIPRDALLGADIREGDAVLISCDFGKYWDDKRFLSASPYFSYEAMEYIISKKPFLLGTDFARWENLDKPEGVFKPFYDADILMLAPCVNLEKISSSRAKLTVLPLNIEKTCCAPCRAIVCE